MSMPSVRWASFVLEGVPVIDGAVPVPVELGLVDLDELADRVDCRAIEPADAARAARFRFDRDRRRYLAARWALRLALAEALALPIDRLRLAADGRGKPFLADPPGAMHFNLSHSGSTCLIALSPAAAVGVDVELPGALDDLESLAEAHFSPVEHELWRALPADRRQHAFLACWTRKEAALKAAGTGLLSEPSALTAGLGPGAAELVVDGLPVMLWSLALPDVTAPAALALVLPAGVRR